MIWPYLEVFTKIRKDQKLFADDKIDKLNRSLTVIVFIIAAIFIGSRNFGTTIVCLQTFVKAAPITVDYVNSLCWLKETIIMKEFFNSSIRVPNDQKPTPNSYPWLPFICIFIAFLFYLPYIIWKFLIRKNTYNNVPVDISSIVEIIKGSSLNKKDDFAKNITIASEYLDRCFSLNNFNDSYLDEKDDFTKYFENDDFKNREPRRYHDRLKKRRMKCCYIPLAVKYLFVKFIYFSLGIFSFKILDELTGFRETFFLYGKHILMKFLDNRHDFKDSGYSEYFPRNVFCDIRYQGDLLFVQTYRYQCTLPANMFNEVVFFVLWIWLVILALFNFFSLIEWTYRFSFRKEIIKSMLIWPFDYKYKVDTYLDSFVDEYLTSEGFLVLMLIKSNTQDWHCRSIVRILWKYYVDRLKSELDIVTPRICSKKGSLLTGDTTVKLTNRRELNYEPLSMTELSTPLRLTSLSQKLSEKFECKNNFGSPKLNEDMV